MSFGNFRTLRHAGYLVFFIHSKTPQVRHRSHDLYGESSGSLAPTRLFDFQTLAPGPWLRASLGTEIKEKVYFNTITFSSHPSIEHLRLTCLPSFLHGSLHGTSLIETTHSLSPFSALCFFCFNFRGDSHLTRYSKPAKVIIQPRTWHPQINSTHGTIL